MARKAGALNIRTMDFLLQYEQAKTKYNADPVDFCYRVMAGLDKSEKWEPGHRVACAHKLMEYRFPKVTAIELTDQSDAENQKEMFFAWGDSNASADSV